MSCVPYRTYLGGRTLYMLYFCSIVSVCLILITLVFKICFGVNIYNLQTIKCGLEAVKVKWLGMPEVIFFVTL